MKIIHVFIFVVFSAFISASISAAGANAGTYIADSDYLKYRMELLQEALSNPLIAERIQNAQTPEEANEVLKVELEERLKKYREEKGLDENGAKKK